MCKKRADGTYRYCKSRRPGARSEKKVARRKEVTNVTRDLTSYLPDEGSVRSPKKAPRALVNAGSAWVSALDHEHVSELRNYTVETDEQVNKYLRRTKGVVGMDALFESVEHREYDEDGNEVGMGTSKSMAETIETLDRALAEAPRLDEPIVVYRGLHCREGRSPQEWAESTFQPGKNLILPSYSSSSADPSEAGRFGGTRPVVMEVVTTRGSYLDSISAYGVEDDEALDLGVGEQEVLFPRNARFKVIGVDHGYLPVDYDEDGQGQDVMPCTFVRMVEVEHPRAED